MALVTTVDIETDRVRFGGAGVGNGGDFDTENRYMRKVYETGESVFQASDGVVMGVGYRSGQTLGFTFRIGGLQFQSDIPGPDPGNSTVLVSL